MKKHAEFTETCSISTMKYETVQATSEFNHDLDVKIFYGHTTC